MDITRRDLGKLALACAPRQGGQARGPGGGAGGRAPLTPEQQAQQASRAAGLKKWRLSVSMDKYKQLRKMYNDAGVQIYCLKLESNSTMSDEEYEYIFHAAEAMGANHVTFELSDNLEFTRRIGDFAARKHMVAASGMRCSTSRRGTPSIWIADTTSRAPVRARFRSEAVRPDCQHAFERS